MRSTAAARRLLVPLVPLVLTVGLTSPVVRADDRFLLGTTGSDPYVFILFDISGSMNWRPGGDFWAPANGDDATSKLYNAKSALFEVLSDPDLADTRWGFATYNQDQVQAFRKHWVYRPAVDPFWVGFGVDYPVTGEPKMFGDDCFWNPNRSQCDLDREDDDVHATCTQPFDLADPFERGQLLSFPVTGDQGDEISDEWFVNNGTTYRVRWELESGNLGDDEIDVRIKLAPRSFFSGCPNVGRQLSDTIRMVRLQDTDLQGNPIEGATDTLFWQDTQVSDILGMPNGFLDPDDLRASATCDGWEANDDTVRDNGSDVALKYVTLTDPANRGTPYDRGDVVPLDWQDESIWGLSNRDAILQRLAPSYDPADLCPPGDDQCVDVQPDFRVAPYFEDHPDTLFGGRLALRSEFTDKPPLLPSGATPLGNSMIDFLDWYDQWEPVAAAEETGDPLFGCRSVTLVILTDGDETCYVDDDGNPDTGQLDPGGNANPCWMADRLLNENGRDIKTYVIGFGLQGSDANFLSCMADNGGTSVADGGPGVILPQDRDELVAALKQVFLEIQSQTASFASAAVPTVQVGVDDKIFLSSFRPVPIADVVAGDEPPPPDGGACDQPPVTPSSIWEGHLNAYLRPLPVDEEGRPDDSIACDPDSGIGASCHLWDAGEAILSQAPNETEIAGCTPDSDDAACWLGTADNQRRIYYPWGPIAEAGAVPHVREYFRPRIDDGALLADMGLLGDACGQEKADQAIRFLLREKEATLDTPDGPEDTVYALGDIFHSRPVLFGAPGRIDYSGGLVNTGATCPESGEPISDYACFFNEHRDRRKLVLVGTNDSLVHAFDAGRVDTDGAFSNGTGKEVFGFLPRSLLPKVASLAETPQHRWGMDGTIVVDDFLVDPEQSSGVVEDEREWRTVAIGGLRRGGSSYFALDVTQPDSDSRPGTDAVAGCADAEPGSDCGTLPFPSILWEFRDLVDEDGNADAGDPGYDLAQTWSTPNTGRIRVCAPNTGCEETEERYVVIFGGGLDPDFWVKRNDPPNLAEPNGNWLYMVDVETGGILYKRLLQGSVPSEPAAVDTAFDSYLDTIYIGTTDGLLYKADISQPVEVDETSGRIEDEAWEPFPVFQSVDTNGAGRPLFFPPSVIFVAKLGRYAVAFGTGDREDLWEERNQDGRFYLILDDNYSPDNPLVELPLTDADFIAIDPTDEDTGTDYLLSPEAGFLPGWQMVLETEERMITKPFALGGITVFTAYVPDVFVQADGEEPEISCAQRGKSRIFTVFTTSGDGVISGVDGDTSRRKFWEVDDFVTDPYTELSVTKNEDPGGVSGDGLTADLQEVMETLKSLYPSDCQFANYTINLKTLRSDTGIFFIAPIPVCLIEKNWREF